MRVRLSCTGWICLGWIIIPTWIVYQASKMALVLLLTLMGELDRHNRRRAARNAYRARLAAAQAEAALRAEVQRQMAQAVRGGLRWYGYADKHPRNPWTGIPEDAPPPQDRF